MEIFAAPSPALSRTCRKIDKLDEILDELAALSPGCPLPGVWCRRCATLVARAIQKTNLKVNVLVHLCCKVTVSNTGFLVLTPCYT